MSHEAGSPKHTDLCSRCHIAFQKVQKHSPEPDTLPLHLNRTFLSGKKSAEKRKIIQGITKRVSALRNSSGGCLLLHLEGQLEGDRYLEHFDEFISHSLQSLIQDGQFYTDAYQRQWLSDVPGFAEYHDFIIFTVAKGDGVTTVDFNTRVVTDNEMIPPTFENMARVLSKTSDDLNSRGPTLRGLHEQLHESRHIQFKAFNPALPKHSDLLAASERLVDYIWENLKLKEYITAFSKLKNGGSFYMGVTEERIMLEKEYRTTKPNIVGFTVQNQAEIRERLECKVRENMLYLHKGIFSDRALVNLVEIGFHEVCSSPAPRFVLEVAVGHFSGLVFYDKSGPRAYVLKENTVMRLEPKKWLQLFMKSLHRCV